MNKTEEEEEEFAVVSYSPEVYNMSFIVYNDFRYREPWKCEKGDV